MVTLFKNVQFLVDIVSFLKELFSVFEKRQILMALFPFGKKYHFYAKSVSFWPNEWIFKYSDKIMSCKLWSKVTSVSLNINFCAKLSILGEKNWILLVNVDFFKQLCTTAESEHLIGKHAYFQKIVTFCVIVYIHQEIVEFR